MENGLVIEAPGGVRLIVPGDTQIIRLVRSLACCHLTLKHNETTGNLQLVPVSPTVVATPGIGGNIKIESYW